MKNQLQVFNFSGNDVRVIMKDEQPWWVLKDVCDVLGLSNSRMVKDRLGDDVSSTYPISDSMGRRQNTMIINEDGLYDVILESRKPEARTFRKWVTKDVLPTIRKHGMYATEELLNNPDLLIQVATQLKIERAERQRLEAEAKEAQPKILFADAVETSHTTILVGELAKIIKQNGYDIGGKRLFAWMRDNGYLIKRKGTDYNMPTQRAMEMELFEIKETVVEHPDGHISIKKTTKVTGKGQVYFVNKFIGSDD